MALDAKIPQGEMNEKWSDYKGHVKLVNPANKRKLQELLLQLHWARWVTR
jgi:succinate dehydrogenase / fumarate reductase flavoprotein subunit